MVKKASSAAAPVPAAPTPAPAPAPAAAPHKATLEMAPEHSGMGAVELFVYSWPGALVGYVVCTMGLDPIKEVLFWVCILIGMSGELLFVRKEPNILSTLLFAGVIGGFYSGLMHLYFFEEYMENNRSWLGDNAVEHIVKRNLMVQSTVMGAVLGGIMGVIAFQVRNVIAPRRNIAPLKPAKAKKTE